MNEEIIEVGWEGQMICYLEELKNSISENKSLKEYLSKVEDKSKEAKVNQETQEKQMSKNVCN